MRGRAISLTQALAGGCSPGHVGSAGKSDAPKGIGMSSETKEQAQAREQRILAGFKMLGLGEASARQPFFNGPVPAPGQFEVVVSNTSQPFGR